MNARILCLAVSLFLCSRASLLADDPTTPARQLSHKELRAKVDVLKKNDVAWRKIAWKTCLLNGLKTSRKENKPVMLWVFIDRPIDDERC